MVKKPAAAPGKGSKADLKTKQGAVQKETARKVSEIRNIAMDRMPVALGAFTHHPSAPSAGGRAALLELTAAPRPLLRRPPPSLPPALMTAATRILPTLGRTWR
jgi:hypothetical protein